MKTLDRSMKNFTKTVKELDIEKTKQILLKNSHYILLAIIILIGVGIRFYSVNTNIIFDYDPWWFFRHAQEILNNGFLPPKWDLFSYFPPGRPYNYESGWPYTLVGAYLVGQIFFPTLTLMKSSIVFIAIFAGGFCAIPAFYFGKHVTNKWGGLVTAMFATITPAFISVSMGGYPDSDAVVVFYTFLSLFATIYALEKRTWKSIFLAVAAFWLFAFNWNSSWYIYYFVVLFVPIYLIFLFIEAMFKKEKVRIPGFFFDKMKENRSLIMTVVYIGIIGYVITLITGDWPFNTINPLEGLLSGLGFLSGQGLIVNISVAELQPVNIFSSQGFYEVASRVTDPSIFLLFLFGFISILIYKLYFRKKISIAEYFTIIWLIIAFITISRGERFSLIFALAFASAAGFTVGNLVDILKEEKDHIRGFLSRLGFIEDEIRQKYQFILSSVFGILIFAFLWHISENIQLGQASSGGLAIGSNWESALNWLKQNADKNSLVATWWDPGHIIAGDAGLHNQADGAHCPPNECVPFNHNIRISDMGEIFFTSNETQSLELLKKYTVLDQSQIEQVKNSCRFSIAPFGICLQRFDSIVPPEAFTPVSDVYLIASSDLIGKYYWLSCFGAYGAGCNQDDNRGRNFLQLNFQRQDAQGNPIYTDGYYYITLSVQSGTLVPILNIPAQRVTNTIISNIVYFQSGQQLSHNFTSEFNNTLDGMVWVDPSFGGVLYMDPQIRDSMFTKLFFFNGGNTTHFQLVFNNPEVKIFKVNF